MLKKLSDHSTISMLQAGCAILLALIVVTSSFTHSMATSNAGSRNSPPYAPNNPVPANGSINVSITTHLSWTGGDPDNDTVTYNVFFGTNQTPPQVALNISATTFDPLALNLSITYYWKIIAWDNNSQSTAGPLWMFTTRGNQPPNIPSNPSPLIHAVDVPVNTELNWIGGDPDNDTVFYDVYLGTNQTPQRIAENITSTPYSPGALHSSTLYYWRIVARDAFNATTAGPLWDFTTIGIPENITVKITKPTPNALYINDQFRRNLSGRTIIINAITITAEVTSPERIKKVECYIDGTLYKSLNSTNLSVYEFNWDPKTLSLKHTIKVIAVDVDNESAASPQINVTKWKLHPLLWLLAGAVIATTLIPHTSMKGLVLNLRQTGPRSYSFFALRVHYHTVSLLKNVHGVLKWKRCVVHFAIPPTVIVKLGPPRTLAYLSIKFLGSDMGMLTHPSGGGFFQNLLPLQGQGKAKQSLQSSLKNSVIGKT